MKNKVGTLKRHNASGYHYCRFNGKMKYLGTKTTTETEAEAMRQSLIRDTVIANNLPTVNDDRASVNELADFYISNAILPDGKKNTTDRIRYISLFTAQFDNQPVRQIKPYQVEKWLATIESMNDTTKCNLVKHLAAMFNWLQRNDKVTYNPLRGVKRPLAAVRGEEYLITPEEYERLLETLSGTYKAIVELLWATGCRPDEILTAVKEEWHPETHEIRKIKHKNMNRGKKRNIVLNARAEEIIAERASKVTNGLLFRSSEGNPIKPDVLMQYMRRRFKEAGITHPCVNYSFRHSAATRWLESNIPIHVVAGWLGDTVATVERHYAHILERVRNTRFMMP